MNVNNVLDEYGGGDVTYNSYPYAWYGYGLSIGRQVGFEISYTF